MEILYQDLSMVVQAGIAVISNSHVPCIFNHMYDHKR